MKAAKRICALLLALALVSAMAACGEKDQTESKAESGKEQQSTGEKDGSKDETRPSETGSEPEPWEDDLSKLKVEIKDSFDGKAAGYTFRVGVGREVITPKLGQPLAGYSPTRNSESVHDDLHIICHAFEQDGLIMLAFAMDTCNCGSADQSIAMMVEYETGVPKANIQVSATHTHSGPLTTDSNYNTATLVPAAVRAAKTALEGLQWAEMGVAAVQSQVGVNRRQLSGKKVILGQDPNGPYDPTMTVISFKNYEGKCISNIIHYGAHNTGSGINTEITRDWCGVMKDAVEELSGGVTAFFNGAQGDVGPRLASGNTKSASNNINEALKHGEIAAKDAVECWKSITEWKKDCKLRQVKGTVYVPYADLDETWIREQLDELLDKANLDTDDTAKRDGLRAGLEMAKSGRTHFDPMEIKARYWALGDVCFVPCTFEMFSETVLAIREGSPYPYTLVISNSNGHDGYFLTESEIPRGGYETRNYWKRTVFHGKPWFKFDATVYYTQDALALIEKLAAQP